MTLQSKLCDVVLRTLLSPAPARLSEVDWPFQQLLQSFQISRRAKFDAVAEESTEKQNVWFKRASRRNKH